MARNTPKMKNGILTREEASIGVAIDTPEWFRWLEQAYSFCYESAYNSFTLHRRDHASRQYWYAYRRKEGQLKTLYAGTTAGLDRSRLEKIALQFDGKNKPDQEDFLGTKFYLPPGPTDLVSRARLLEKLDTAGRYKLVLVVAPPGYGKTTLLAEWAKSGKKQVAWVSLDEIDDDPARVIPYLTTALEPFIPTMARDKAEGINLTSVEMVLATILEATTRLTTDTFLVLDDFHFIQADKILLEITSLLVRLPPRLHLIISSRTTPAIPLGGLRAKGQVLELKPNELSFTAEEAQKFFNLSRSLNISGEQVRQLWERSEGWVAGIKLAALSLPGVDEYRAGEFIRTFSGSQPYVFEYLAEEVLSRQPEEMQRFLLGTSILSRLNASLCESVTGQTGGQEKLAQVEKNNLFIVPLDSHREWYRYHHLFAQFLQTRLHQSAGSIHEGELHHRAAVWYEHHNMIGEAIKHEFAAGNFEQAASLVAASGRKLLVRGEIATLKSWLETIPPAIVSTSLELELLYTWTLVLGGQLVEAEDRYIRLEKNIPSGEAQAIRLVLVLQKGDIEEIGRLGDQPFDNLEEAEPFIRSIQALVTGFTQDFFGDSANANRAYLASSLLGQAAGNTLLVQIATTHVGDILFLQGQLQRAAETYRRAMDPFPAEEQPQNGLRATTLVYQSYSMVLYELNQLEEAAKLLEEAIRLNSTFAYHMVIGICMAQLAEVREAQGDHQGAQEAIVQATEAVHRIGLAWLAQYASTILARVNLKLGNLGEVRAWAKVFPTQFKDSGKLTPFMSYMNEMSRIVLAKLYLKEGKVAETLDILEQLEPEAARRGWVKWVLEIQVLRAAALRASGKERAALLRLKETLFAGEKEGFIRSFADHGDVLGNLLEKASENLDQAYRRKLLEASGRPGNVLCLGNLSDREREVLKLAASGRSNEEIARELTVGVSTVKTHLLHIYDKLSVHNRNQAAATARELGLI